MNQIESFHWYLKVAAIVAWKEMPKNNILLGNCHSFERLIFIFSWARGLLATVSILNPKQIFDRVSKMRHNIFLLKLDENILRRVREKYF